MINFCCPDFSIYNFLLVCDQNHYAVEKNLLIRTSSEIPLIAYWRDLWATATLESLILNREGRLEILVRYRLAYIYA